MSWPGPTGGTCSTRIVDVPLERVAGHASLSFAPKVGFGAMLAGNTRHLALPVDEARLEELRAEVRTRP